ncbi:tyrosine-type recombinase/integrase [Persicobacter psychrovividus]|uniref:Tyrosine recombinase XerC n=1 Tax=Persicobacter psychrovividus TaxID=387638 RepID=A0ABN6L4L5_9BACT|nr:integrase [Persicobacter psychrovividus]
MIKDFLRYMALEKRVSQHTLVSYEQDLFQFSTFIAGLHDGNPDLLKVSYQDIRQWIMSLSEEKRAVTTINRKVACLKSYYKFCLKREFIRRSPAEDIKSLKKPKQIPQFIPEKEINQLLDQLGAIPETFQEMRDRLIIELLYGTGMRRAEIISLKVIHFDKKNYTIRVSGKGNKIRVIPLNNTLRTLIPQYLEQKQIQFPDNLNDFLIVTNKGQQAYPTFIYNTVKKHLSIFQTLSKKSPHVLRHTFATHLLNRGADLNAIKDLLGHSSLSATQVYTHNSIGKLKDVFNQAHPKAE